MPTTSPSSRLRLAVIGAGVIGQTHIDRAQRSASVELVAMADPSSGAVDRARDAGVPGFADHRALLDAVKPQAVVVATPNATHAPITIDCLERGVAVLVEKPIAESVAAAQRICDASRATGVPVLVGHQRRHNAIVRRARAIIAAGTLGRLVSASVLCTWLKPRAYFDAAWRREPGGGPILINLIHDIDLLRHLFGEIESVQALASNAVRGHPVEDTAVAALRFRNGALGTLTVSDTAAAPWNYDLAAGEAERFPRQDINAHFYCGTAGSLTLPRLEVWRYRAEHDAEAAAMAWEDPLSMERAPVHTGCPYVEQLRHFAAVVQGTEPPLCSALDGTATLQATLAVAEAAASGRPVTLPADA